MSDGTVTQPVPPRFRQLKRWTLFALAALALLAGLRAWWGYEAQRRMSAYVAAAHARGQKVLPEDFPAGPSVPAEQNGAPLLDAAARAIRYTARQQVWADNYAMTLPLTAADEANIRGIASANRRSLDQVRQARSLPAVDWGVRPSYAQFTALLPQFNRQRALTLMLAQVALYEHHAGNDAEAVELLLDLHYQQAAVGQSAPFVVATLTAHGISALLRETLATITPTLRVADAAPGAGTAAATTTMTTTTTTPAVRPAPRERVRELAERLLDDADVRRAAVAAWDGETAMGLEMAPRVLAADPALLTHVLRPMYVLDNLRMARARATDRAAATQPTLPAAMETLVTPSRRAKSHLHQLATMLSDLGRSQRMVHEAQFRTMTERRAAALMLAIRLYEIDHGGALPPTLAALVPSYLSRVPLDPMARDPQQPFGYRPRAAAPFVYSVGVDGIDNGGAATSATRWRSDDVVYLIPRPRAGAATRSGSGSSAR